MRERRQLLPNHIVTITPIFYQTQYMKAKEQARKESEHISITDLDLDDIGFSGPLINKDTNDVFADVGDELEAPSSNASPQVKRVSSYTSLTESDVRYSYF